MKNIFEIDCNEPLWDEITSGIQNGWGNFENECRFAFQTKSKNIDEDDIDSFLWEEFKTADSINVSQIKGVDGGEKGMRYFGASVIIYQTSLLES